MVPPAALRNVLGARGEVVVCDTDRKARVRVVTPGRMRGGLLEVSGDLVPGALVAIKPVLGLDEGDAIEAAP